MTVGGTWHPGMRVDAYRLLESFGGRCRAWRAQEEQSGLRVVVKSIDSQERTALEILSATPATLEHIVEVIVLLDDVAVFRECGRPLSETLTAGIPTRQRIPLVRQLLAGLQELHSLGLTHGDLTPRNVIIDPYWRLRLIDFGHSKPQLALDHSLDDESDKTQGSAFYVDPALADGRQTSARSDLFAAGLIAWEILHGRRPDLGESLPIWLQRCVGAWHQRFESAEEALSALADASPQSTPDKPLDLNGTPDALIRAALTHLESSRALSNHELVGDVVIDQFRCRLSRLEATRPDLLRVVLCGEFKSGKSTLINALAHADVAAVDQLEMTSWIAEYYPTTHEQSFCEVLTTTGTSHVLPLADFMELCENRQFADRFTEEVDRVRVGVSHELPFTLVDTPGTGSTTASNEATLLRALEDADLVLWVLDCHSLGSVRDAALIAEAQRLALPTRLVVTQCDTLDCLDEVDDIRDHIADDLDYDLNRVHMTAAALAVNARSEHRPPPTTSGLSSLRQALTTEVSRQGAALRERARRAQALQLAVDLSDTLQQFLAEVDRHEITVGRLRTELEAIGAAVFKRAEAELHSAASHRFLADHAESIIARITTELGAKRRLTQKRISAIVRDCVGPTEVDRFWADEICRVRKLLVEWWAAETNVAATTLSETTRIEGTLLLHDLGEFVSSGDLVLAATTSSNVEFQSHVEQSLAIAAVASGYVAWLGPAASAVSIGSAIWGLGLPLFGIGLAVSALSSSKRGTPTDAEARSKCEAVMDQLRAHACSGIVDGVILPRLRVANQGVIDAVLREYAESSGGFRLGELQVAKERALQLIPSLRLATQG